MNYRPLASSDAFIRTAAVELKALTVSGKQMTQGVFRQLENEPLLNENTAELAGVPWGRVNYFWGNCSNNHLHVVWQKGAELRVACVWHRHIRDGKWVPRFIEDCTNRIAKIVDALTIQMALRGEHWLDRTTRSRYPYPLYAPLRIGGYNTEIYANWPQIVTTHVNDLEDKATGEHCKWGDGWDVRLADQRNQLLLMLKAVYGYDEDSDITGCLDKEINTMDNFIEKYDAQYNILSSLDQLFIAV